MKLNGTARILVMLDDACACHRIFRLHAQ